MVFFIPFDFAPPPSLAPSFLSPSPITHSCPSFPASGQFRSAMNRVIGLGSALSLVPKRCSSAAAAVQSLITKELDGIKAAGTWKTERVITSPQAADVSVEGMKGDIINFCANNYLGLASHPRVVESAAQCLKTHGAGMSSVRFICGTTDIHKKLEQKIAHFHGREDSILFPSCFDANAAIFETLLTPEDCVISDELNHASIIDGIRLCRAKRFRYLHGDMKDLERCLEEAKDCRVKLIATDGVFSMDGDIAKLPQILELAEEHKAITFIDECHATGFFGETGRGTEEYYGLQGKVTIINSTLGKAMGGASGGYTTGSKELVALLRQRGRPYLFSNSLPPAVVGAALGAFDLLIESSNLPQKLHANVKLFRDTMTERGFKLSGDYCHPIAPVMLGDARLAAQFADAMLQHGIYVIGFSYPVVPKGKARIRVQISAAHSQEQIIKAIDAFTSVGRKLSVIQ
ncbi:2-amino-3-ketobutyrate coenzyme A ligase [Echinococcus granulosus]|uniref:2-amino-3-ketobutyrate coenzyme A ligase n=1 Tax=Echinococcus granulosus TaxID=6210 RepID=W6UDQ6_ECHGR|nr:2-amino-3-ketobutyrate coenzyme A ligase [Echinococcus granulosus]EUB59470.1 2-amino-3-ketobutyrate coenzyme A ligase [Echinococcus granulosus]